MQLLTTAVTYRNRITFVPEPCPELNRTNRIIEALGAAHIPKVDEGPLNRYYEYLMEHLNFPFIAHFPEAKWTAKKRTSSAALCGSCSTLAQTPGRRV